MQYLGGKHRLAKTISRFLEFHRKPGQAPSDFRCVAEMPTRLSVRSKKGAEPRIERLFQYDP